MKDLLLLLLALALTGPFLVIATKSILTHFSTLLFLGECHGRTRTVQRIASTTVVICALIGLYLFGLKRINSITFFVLAITPWATYRLTALSAWWRDSSDDRAAALVIATERAIRHNEAVPSLSQRWPWADYLFDVEFAKRRAAYEPPAI